MKNNGRALLAVGAAGLVLLGLRAGGRRGARIAEVDARLSPFEDRAARGIVALDVQVTNDADELAYFTFTVVSEVRAVGHVIESKSRTTPNPISAYPGAIRTMLFESLTPDSHSTEAVASGTSIAIRIMLNRTSPGPANNIDSRQVSIALPAPAFPPGTIITYLNFEGQVASRNEVLSIVGAGEREVRFTNANGQELAVVVMHVSTLENNIAQWREFDPNGVIITEPGGATASQRQRRLVSSRR